MAKDKQTMQSDDIAEARGRAAKALIDVGDHTGAALLLGGAPSAAGGAYNPIDIAGNATAAHAAHRASKGLPPLDGPPVEVDEGYYVDRAGTRFRVRTSRRSTETPEQRRVILTGEIVHSEAATQAETRRVLATAGDLTDVSPERRNAIMETHKSKIAFAIYWNLTRQVLHLNGQPFADVRHLIAPVADAAPVAAPTSTPAVEPTRPPEGADAHLAVESTRRDRSFP